MADDLQGIVQRMLDAGESEENIATVIRAQAPAEPFDINKSRAVLTLANQKPLPAQPSFGAAFVEGVKHPWTSDTPESLAAVAANRKAGGPRPDSNVLGNDTGAGIAPEDILMLGQGAASVGSAIKGGTGVTGKLAAGAKSVATHAAPVVKYEVTRTALMGLGVPAPVAAVIALGVSGKGGAKAGEAVKAPKPTVPIAEQLGLQPESLGATMPQTHDPISRPQPLWMGDPSLRGPEPVINRPAPGARMASMAPSAVDIAAQEFGGINPNVPNKRTVSNIEAISTSGGPNASGESGASREALSRLSSMRAKGEMYGVLRGGKLRPLIGPEAVDYVPQPGEQYGIIDSTGGFRMLSGGR